MSRWGSIGPALLLVAAGCVALPGFQSAPRPFLFEVERNSPAFVFGTLHLPDERLLELPLSVTAALEESDVLYNEVLLAPGDEPKLAGELPEPEVLPPLSQRVPPDVYARIQDYLRKEGKLTSLFDRAPLWVVTQQLALVDYVGVTTLPLDFFLAKQAQAAGLELGGLETPTEQLEALGARDPEAELRALQRTLEDLEWLQERGRDPVEALIRTYLGGSTEKLHAYMHSQVDSSDPEEVAYIEALLDARSVSMAASIADVLEQRQDRAIFFAVGAGHLVGPRNVIEELRKRGFAVERSAP